MSVLEYERRLHDLSLFALHYIPTEEHMIEKLRDGLQQELKQGLIALQFKLVREPIEATQALEACIGEGPQGHQGIGKKRDRDFTSRPPLPKKGKSGMFEASKKKETIVVLFHQQLSGRVMGGQTHPRANLLGGIGDRENVHYPHFVKCKQRHPRDYSVSPAQCFICREEGHRWRNCQYLG